jgi:hypothetical protein
MNHCCLDFFREIVAQSTDDPIPYLFLCRILLYSHYDPHTFPLLPFTHILHSHTFRICCPTIHDTLRHHYSSTHLYEVLERPDSVTCIETSVVLHWRLSRSIVSNCKHLTTATPFKFH